MDETRAAAAAMLRAPRRPSPWLAPGLPLLVLVVTTAGVLAGGPLADTDRWIRDLVQAQAGSATWRWLGDTRFAPAQLVVDLGNNQVAVPVLAACSLIAAFRRRSPLPMLAAAAGVVLLLGTVIPAKILIGRPGPGPGQAEIAPGGLGVFPSGHTTTAAVCFGLGVLLVVPGPPARSREVVLAVTAAVCFLVGAALIWCDYHWFSDVVGGWALAALIVQACLVIAYPRGRIGGIGGR